MAHPLKSFRETRRLTQQRVADAMGIRRDAVAKIEGGSRSVSVGELAKLREGLALSDAEVSTLIEHLGRAEAA